MIDRKQGISNRGEEPVALNEPVASDAGASAPRVLDEEAEFQRLMELAREVMIDHHNVLAALAK